MKHIAVIVFLISLNLSSNAQQGVRASLSVGVPVNKSTDRLSSNYNFDFTINKSISSHSFLGVGASYLAVNLLQSPVYLTFDRQVLSFFGTYVYEINLSEKMKILPQICVGYSFINSKLNELPDEIRKTGGMYIAEEIHFALEVFKNIDISVGTGFSTIFSKLKSSSDLIVPQNYIGKNKNTINQFTIKIGCLYRF